MNPNMLKRLIALERIRTGVSPYGKDRSHEHIAGLMTDVYYSLWNDCATLHPREERYLHNLTLLEEWSSTSLTDKLERYQELFS